MGFLKELFQFSVQYITLTGLIYELLDLPAKIVYLFKRCFGYDFSDQNDVIEVSEQTYHEFPSKSIEEQVIICIHGSSSCPLQWSYTLPELRKIYPRHSIILPNLSRKDLSFNDYFTFLDKLVCELNENRIRISAMIGTSMGGLLAAWIAEKSIPYSTQVITINAPFRGAPALRFLPLRAKRYHSMHPDSPFLTGLAEMIQLSKHRYLFVVAQDDFQVPPAFGSTETQMSQILCFRGGHTSALIRVEPYWKTIRIKLKAYHPV